MSNGRADCTHACLTCSARNAEAPAPSHQRRPLAARRRSGGVVMITYATAIPAETRTTFATARASESVIGLYSLAEPRMRSDLLSYVEGAELAVSRTYFWASCAPFTTASLALLYTSRPFSAH